ncbi:MAG TPA: SIS domain-containing protein [Gemmatimonadaceae bacterium]|nr:SIS domain-containing protein [Gemmatimonadaceae bacterium]
MSPDRDFARDLYPFLYPPAGGAHEPLAALLDSVRSSTLAKCAEVTGLRSELLSEYEELLERTAGAMAMRFASGGKLLAFGNGGSATDADDAAADCVSPPVAGWRPLPALSLPADSATVTAVANDVGLESVFVRQLCAIGERGDIALGISTSGNSGNVVAAFTEAKRRGMLTVALTGYDGGAVARTGAADFCFVARREFVPRIQEGHATLWHTLLELVQRALATPVEVDA